jgi:hypothetical protein
MIPREGMQKAKEVASGSGVNDLLNSWKWVQILWASFVEASEVHAKAPAAMGFVHNHLISYPHGVCDFTYQPRLLELLNLLNDELLLFWSLSSSLLLHCACLRAHS